MRKVLVLAGDAPDLPELAKKAEVAGFETVTVKGTPDEALLQKAALEAGARGIVPLSVAVREVTARVCTRLHWAGIGTAESFADWREVTGNQVAAPRHLVVATDEEAAAAVAELGTPVWLRPATLGGQPFRMTLDHAADLSLVLGKVRSHAATVPVLVQQPVQGVSCSVVGFRFGRAYHAVECVNGLLLDPAFEVNFGLSLPFAGGGLAYKKAIEAAHRAAEVLPAGHYLLEMGFVLTEGGPVLTRMHAPVRFSPALVALLRHAYAVDLEAGMLRVAAGEPPAEAPRRAQGAAVRWLNLGSGTVKDIEGVEAARQLPGVCEVHIAAQVGDAVGHILDRDKRDAIGWVLATGGRRVDAEARAEAALNTLNIVTQKIS